MRRQTPSRIDACRIAASPSLSRVASSRRATSRCTITDQSANCDRASSSRRSSGVAAEYGRLATRRARPGERDYGSFAVLHALATRVEVVAQLPADAFFPTPRVVSSFVRITPRPEADLAPAALRAVERVARAAFGQRRKTLRNALRGAGFGAAGGGANRLDIFIPHEAQKAAPTSRTSALRGSWAFGGSHEEEGGVIRNWELLSVPLAR